MRKKNFRLWADHAWYVPGVKGMFALLGMFILGALLSAVIQGLLMLFMTPEEVIWYGQIVVYPVTFLPAMVFVAYQSKTRAMFDQGYALDSRHFGSLGFWGAIGVTVLLTFATMLLADPLNFWNARLTENSTFLSRFYDLMMQAMKAMTGGPFWSSFLVVAIFAPIFEEWLCRGVILRGLLTKMKPGWAITVSALFFAVIHGNPWQALNAFIIGMVMGFVYYRTGSLLLTMIIHFINNGTSVVMSHIEALKDFDYFNEMMPQTAYGICIAVAALVFVGALWLFSRISTEHPWGNADPVKALEEA